MIGYIVVRDVEWEGSSIEDDTQVYLDKIAAREAALKLDDRVASAKGRVVPVRLPNTLIVNQSGTFTLIGGEQITNVHPLRLCEGRACCVHNPSDHHMKDWPQRFVEDSDRPGLMQRVCAHGDGHPDPDHMAWYASCHTAAETREEGTHTCDGCCRP